MSALALRLQAIAAVSATLILGGTCMPIRENWMIRKLFYPPAVDMSQKPDSIAGLSSVDHGEYALLLGQFVAENGRVNYGGLKTNEAALARYLEKLAHVKRENLSSGDDLALLINAYNACTLKLMLENPGVQSIRDIPESRRWKDQRWIVGGKRVSLDTLEHEWIRARHKEPLVHFALVCASVGCPHLRKEPYVGIRVKEQLKGQARKFFARRANLQWIPGQRKLRVTELMDWFRGDFVSHDGSLVRFLFPLVDPEIAAALEKNETSIQVEYLPYDWSINGTWHHNPPK